MKVTKETLRRAWRTFLQAFLGVLVGQVALLSAVDFDADPKTVLVSVLVQIIAPAISAGLSAIMNLEVEEASEEGIAESEDEE